MSCYSVPLAAALILFIARKIRHSKDRNLWLLNIIFAGGAVMLVIDHWINGELFLTGDNIGFELALGAAMTLGAAAFWAIIIVSEKAFAANKTKIKI